MKLAFALYKYFPYGGLQRDFLQIAKEALARGHLIHVFVRSWHGDIPAGFHVHYCPFNALSNHVKYKHYYHWLTKKVVHLKPDCVIGFNKMPGLDIYFAADPCFAVRAEHYPFWKRLGGRYKHFTAFERAAFDPKSGPLVLHLTDKQKNDFVNYYHTPAERFYRLPPGIARDRCIKGAERKQLRTSLRQKQAVTENEIVLLQVGSGFRIKGLDRSLIALANLPKERLTKTHLWVVGQDNAMAFQRQAKILGVDDRIHFLGGRDDIPALLAAADLMIHPAYSESAGMTLLEGIVAGLPVLTTDTCGFAQHIVKAEAGIVIPSPFEQSALNEALEEMLSLLPQSDWSAAALAYAQSQDLYSLASVAVDVIEHKMVEKRNYG